MSQIFNISNLKKHPMSLGLMFGAFCYVALFSSLNMLVGYFFGGEPYTFRADNFWAFSSGIFRRAMIGQFIYYLDLVTGYGPLLYSLALWALFLLVTSIVYRECWKTVPKPALLFLLISPLVLIYQVDSEILLLLPLVYLLLCRSKVNHWLLVSLTIAAIMVREIALILYMPLLVSVFIKGRLSIKVMVALATCASVFLHLYKGVEPNFILETEYWPNQGIPDINSHFLYYFIDKSLGDVLTLHVNYMLKDKYIFLPGVFTFLSIVVWVIYSRTQSAFIAAYFVACLLVIGVLTIDYGRYFYFFFYFAILISQPKAAVYFKLDDLPKQLASLKELLSLPVALAAKFMSKNHRVLFGLCIVFALSPCGFSAGEYSFYPRAYIMAEVILGYL